MTRLGSRIRPLTTAALALALALSAGACDKGGDSKNPGGKGGDGTSTAPAEGGKDYSYAAEGFTLTATMKVKMELNTSQGQGAAEIQARSLIEAAPEGGQLKVHGKVLELIGYTGSGNLDPEFIKKQSQEQGGEAMDIVESLRGSESWSIMDLKGKADEKASEALAENQRAEGDDGPMDMGLFGLPDLPAVDLKIGEKVELPTQEKDEQMPFGTVPVQVDETWTLRAIDESSGKRIAELDVTIESSGATEISGGQGSAMVSVLEESAYTIFFDLDAHLPVSFSGYSQSETNIDMGGEGFSMAVNNEVEATYQPGAPAEAAAPPAEAAAPPAEAVAPTEG